MKQLAERVNISPPTLRRWFNGFCTTRTSREFGVAQKPLNYGDKPRGEKLTGSPCGTAFVERVEIQ